MKAFIESQFGCCPLVRVLHSRTLNTRINNIHGRALRLVYNDSTSTFKESLRLDKSFTIHERNVQSLAVEIFKVIHDLSPEIMREVFVPYQVYCSRQMFDTGTVRTVHNGIEILKDLGNHSS